MEDDELLAEQGVLGSELGIAAIEFEDRAEKDRIARWPGELEGSVFQRQQCGVERMRRINRWTKEDMQKGPSTDNQNASMEYIAGRIEVYCLADGVFGQDR